jgi:isoamylase
MRKQKQRGIEIEKGFPYPFGATTFDNGINFAIYVKEAQEVILCFFDENNPITPFQEFELDPKINRTGEVWHAYIKQLPHYSLYGYRINHQEQILLDPYAKGISSPPVWRSRVEEPYLPVGKIVDQIEFDWESDQFPRIPKHDLVIYEMHVRGFTANVSSNVQYPGTFLGIVEKIPYLKSLGINAIELMPIFEFNENEAQQVNPLTGEKLCNYFGYSTVNFFSPMNRYASQSIRDRAILEFKAMVKELHRAGIEIYLDVVYNHSFEGNEKGPTLEFRGIAPSTYYMIDEHGSYLNFSGCGNTINSNHPIVREFILTSLRYWVSEMHVDGFRFDLASILTRAENGTPLNNAPIVEAISLDPILADTKLIAEAWDAGGLYQVGGFYPGNRWSEWNGRYRDVIRKFIKGTAGHKSAFATAICGSQDLYGWRGTPTCSINFVTCHDGFSLADLTSYNNKHNEANGEDNRDGFDHNDSWNCGAEGFSNNKKIIFLRERQMRNFLLALMVSQGIPMLLMGDEYAHTRKGNNNTWCQDNELNWFLWNQQEGRPAFFDFVKFLIQFRKDSPLLSRPEFLTPENITWHGLTLNNPDWLNDNGLVAFTLNNPDRSPGLYIAFNAFHIAQSIAIPHPGKKKHWYWVINTHNAAPEDFFDDENSLRFDSHGFRIPSYTAIMLKAK